jgi:hypothetical protein
MMGHATARLYGLRVLRWKCALITALCALAGTSLWMINYAIGDFDPTAGPSDAMVVSLPTIVSLLMVVPVAFYIERHQTRTDGKDRSSVGPQG